MPYDQRYMVKQRMGQMTTKTAEFVVYTTGVPGWYLFRLMQQISPGTFVETSIEVPHRSSDMVRGWKRKLH